MSKELTQKQQIVLDKICDYIAVRGYPPSIKDLSGMLAIKSNRGVTCHLIALERKGFIRRDEGIPRGIAILKQLDATEVEN